MPETLFTRRRPYDPSATAATRACNFVSTADGRYPSYVPAPCSLARRKIASDSYECRTECVGSLVFVVALWPGLHDRTLGKGSPFVHHAGKRCAFRSWSRRKWLSRRMLSFLKATRCHRCACVCCALRVRYCFRWVMLAVADKEQICEGCSEDPTVEGGCACRV